MSQGQVQGALRQVHDREALDPELGRSVRQERVSRLGSNDRFVRLETVDEQLQ